MKIELDKYDKILLMGLAQLGMETVAGLKERYAYLLDQSEQNVLLDQLLFYSAIVQHGTNGMDYKSEVERTEEGVLKNVARLTAISERIHQVQMAEDTGSGTLQ